MRNQKFFEDYPDGVAAVYNGEVDVAWSVTCDTRFMEYHLIRSEQLGGPVPSNITMKTDTDRAKLVNYIKGELDDAN